MERLTLVPNDGSDAGLRGYCAEQDAINRLAAYEDTGLEPDEVDQIRRAAQTMMFPTVADFVRYAIQNFEDLEKYRKAEAEGHLFMTPCKEGDTVWTIWDDEVRENTVLGVTVDRYGLHILAQYNQGGAIRDYNFDRIGKTVFLTREAAEAALKERDGAHQMTPTL